LSDGINVAEVYWNVYVSEIKEKLKISVFIWGCHQSSLCKNFTQR
jgi:hypothetical protein